MRRFHYLYREEEEEEKTVRFSLSFEMIPYENFHRNKNDQMDVNIK